MTMLNSVLIVIGKRSCVQVRRIYARFVAATMQDKQPIWHGAIGEFIGIPMHGNTFIAIRQSSVSIAEAALPYPALVGAALVYHVPEPGFKVISLVSRAIQEVLTFFVENSVLFLVFVRGWRCAPAATSAQSVCLNTWRITCTWSSHVLSSLLCPHCTMKQRQKQMGQEISYVCC